jgi:hypothetical protein
MWYYLIDRICGDRWAEDMCERHKNKKIYKCSHTTESSTVVRCSEAETRGSDCPADRIKDIWMASTKRPGDCSSCKDEGYSDPRTN